MAIELTTEESQKVSKQNKSEANLPTYYDAVQKLEVKISRDFENFLILSAPDLKREASNWIQRVKLIKQDTKSRDEILKEAISLENTDATEQVTAYAAKLTEFDKFRSKFNAGKFVSVSEISKFLDDLQLVIGEMIINRDKAYYNKVFSKLLTTRLGYDAETSEKERQLKSWLTPLGAYY